MTAKRTTPKSATAKRRTSKSVAAKRAGTSKMVGATMAPATAETSYRAFGADVTLVHADDPLERARQLDQYIPGYEAFLASRVIPKTGLCVDVGAGDGWFAIAFAQAFRDWQVLCFEPDAAAADRLRATAQACKLDNVICVTATFHPDTEVGDMPGPAPDGLADWAATLGALERPQRFQRLRALGGRLDPLPSDFAPNLPDTSAHITAPTLPLSVLRALSPDLIKLDAPGCEYGIVECLQDCSIGFMTGQLYSYVPSTLFTPTQGAGAREYYLQCGTHALRRDYEDNFANRKARLDVVVAMYNTVEYIIECVDSVLADGNADIRVLVVDDGSTDGCDALVAQTYADNPRVVLVSKPNGGCASARNYGRVQSDASHIAFIDADDRIDFGMFSALLETARYTGAFVVEGEFQFLHHEEDGSERLEPSYEADIYAMPGDQGLGAYDYTWLPGEVIGIGQPTIWRRIHRRDFLDRKDIWFPEHIRAFDDQIFQMLVAQYCGSLAHVRGYHYHYRQHPAQDIKQGDERHFYSFNMFRAILQRSLNESWPNIEMVVQSLLNTMSWSYGGLRPDLKLAYQTAAVEFIVVFHKTYGYMIDAGRLRDTGIEGLDLLVERKLEEVRHDPVNYGMIQQDTWCWQPEMIRMMKAARQK
jgi:FkbM family methyltransferase